MNYKKQKYTNKSRHSRVALIYLLWSQEPYDYLIKALECVADQTYPQEYFSLVIVYNSHKEGEKSAFPYIEEQVERYRAQLPQVVLLPQKKNLGFSGGNNAGMQWSIDHGYDYVFLHNADGFLANSCIEKMAKALDADRAIGAAQAMVLLGKEPDLINTSGNCWHYLGFGYSNNYRRNVHDFPFPKVLDINYASGAAIMMRCSFLKKYGLWDDDYFMYHEDTDYSYRLYLLGYRIVLVSDAVFYHLYNFSKSITKYYWMERNRYAFLLVFLKWRTLLLLLPMLLVMELGLIFFSLKGGWFTQRLKVYRYWLRRESWNLWLLKRKHVQKTRVRGDREMLQHAVGDIIFQEDSLENPILLYVANPLMRYYLAFLRVFVRW